MRSDLTRSDPGHTGRVLVTLAALLGVLLVVAVSLGTVTVPVATVWRHLAAHLGLGVMGDPARLDPLTDQIVWTMRTPRVLVAAVVGAGLAAAGVALQGLVRNPLADPYVLGVSSGASFGAVVVLTLGSAAAGGLSVSGAAFAGAIASLAAVFVLSGRTARMNDNRLVLAGVAVGYLAMAATSFVQLRAPAGQVRGILFWLMGSVAGATWSDLGVPALVIAGCTAWLLLQGRALNALAVGDDDAAALGVDVPRLRVGLLVVSALLTATAVAVAGGVGFVGLMVPHAARLVVGADHRRLLPTAALAGAVFLVAVDLAARTVDRPNEYPVTVFGRLPPPGELIPALLGAASDAGVTLDYVAREAACAQTAPVGHVSPATLLAAQIVEEPTPGRIGARPSVTDSGWLCNGVRSPGGDVGQAMELAPAWAPPQQNAARRHSIFVDVQLWDDVGPRRTWSCPMLAATWQTVRLGLLRVDGAPILAPQALPSHLPEAWDQLPAVMQVHESADPFFAYRTVSVLSPRFLPVELAVRTILGQVHHDDAVGEQIAARARGEGLQLPLEIPDRINYAFTGSSETDPA